MHISTLVSDIYSTVQRKDGWFTPLLADEFGKEVSVRLQEKFNAQDHKPTIRISKLGPVCPCAFWYSLYKPEEAEPLPAWAEIKYSYGHILEALIITLAKAAGHEVTGEQDAVVVDGIVGHRDCVIDGCIVDVKSASSFGFGKFKDGSIKEDDSFGYLDQLDGYLVGSANDPLVRTKDTAYILAVDKTLGHVVLYEHKLREKSVRERIKTLKEVASRNEAPSCTCGTLPDGKSGNIKLDTKASYNSFKHCCFPKLRTFLYSEGPRYLTRVVKRPQRSDGTFIPEVDRYGKIIYTS